MTLTGRRCGYIDFTYAVHFIKKTGAGEGYVAFCVHVIKLFGCIEVDVLK